MPTVPEKLIFGEHFERCPQTGRPFETGIGALPKAQQTANFIRDRDRAADMPKAGEVCPRTGREYEVGTGAHTRLAQTARFIREAEASGVEVAPLKAVIAGNERKARK